MNSSEGQLQKIKQTLQNLLSNLPEQFALQEVKTNLMKTLQSINEVQKKRIKRKERFEQQNKTGGIGFMSMEDAKKALQILDDMMKQEEKTISDANSKNTKPDTSNGLFLG